MKDQFAGLLWNNSWLRILRNKCTVQRPWSRLFAGPERVTILFPPNVCWYRFFLHKDVHSINSLFCDVGYSIQLKKAILPYISNVSRMVDHFAQYSGSQAALLFFWLLNVEKRKKCPFDRASLRDYFSRLYFILKNKQNTAKLPRRRKIASLDCFDIPSLPTLLIWLV